MSMFRDPSPKFKKKPIDTRITLDAIHDNHLKKFKIKEKQLPKKKK